MSTGTQSSLPVDGAAELGRREVFGYLIHWNEVDSGGQFAAWEHLPVFSDVVRAAFRLLR